MPSLLQCTAENCTEEYKCCRVQRQIPVLVGRFLRDVFVQFTPRREVLVANARVQLPPK